MIIIISTPTQAKLDFDNSIRHCCKVASIDELTHVVNDLVFKDKEEAIQYMENKGMSKNNWFTYKVVELNQYELT